MTIPLLIVASWAFLIVLWSLHIGRRLVDWTRARALVRQCLDALVHYMAGPHL